MVTTIKPNFILIEDIIDNRLISMKYINYTQKEAEELFKEQFLK